MQKPKKGLATKAKPTVDAKMKELQEKIQDPRYAHQKYEADKFVTIPATLFADFLNTNNEEINFLIQLRNTLVSVTRAMDMAIAKQDAMTLNLMEQHIINVDAGNTTALSPEEFESMVNPKVAEETPQAAPETTQE
jgi:hypothetical protein